ncbi:juvenile hormone acid O-methyltransferase-like [Amblyomma americanum]
MSKKSSATEARSTVEAESAAVYSATMGPYRESSLDILNMFEKSFSESYEGVVARSDVLQKPQFLDVACGAGNFTFNSLLPRYMAHCRRIVAVDKAPSMIRFAKLHHKHEKITYDTLDIVDGDIESFVRQHGLFARVFSFNLLHWVKDPVCALKNIEKLLAPDGECFIIFQHCIPMFEVNMALAESERWKKYAKVLEDVIPATARNTNFSAMRQNLQNLVDETNLKPLACEVLRVPRVNIPCIQGATERIVSFNPIYNLLNDEEKEELFKFIEKFLSDQVQAVADGSIPNQRFTYVIHAYKPAALSA